VQLGILRFRNQQVEAIAFLLGQFREEVEASEVLQRFAADVFRINQIKANGLDQMGRPILPNQIRLQRYRFRLDGNTGL